MFPKRGAISLALTAVALVLLINFKTPDDQGRFGPGRATGVVIPGSTATPPPTQAPSRRPGTGGQVGVGGPTTTPSPAPTPRPTSPASGASSGEVTGTEVDTRYGPVQVVADFTNGKITDIQAKQLPYDRQRSAMISQYVEPILHDEVLQAQSSQIDIISGATYTSEAYAQSLQSAIDQVSQ